MGGVRDLLTTRLAKTKHGSIIHRKGLCKSPAGTPSWLETSPAGCRPGLYGSRQEGKTEGSRLHGDSPRLRHADPAQIKVSQGGRAPRLLSQWFGPGQHSLPVRRVRDVHDIDSFRGPSHVAIYREASMWPVPRLIHTDTSPGPAEAPKPSCSFL